MTMNLQELYDQKRNLLAQEKALSHKFQEDNIWDDAREQEFQRLESELKGVENSIRVAEREEEAEKRNATPYQEGGNEDTRSEDQIYAQDIFPKLFQKELDPNKLNETERQIFDNVHERADLGTSSSGGGVLVPTETQDRIIQRMKFMGGVRPVADVTRTRDGRTFSFPFSDNTADAGEQISENPASDTATLNPSFSEKKIESFLYSSKEFLVSRQLLQDSQFDLVSKFEEFAARRIFNVLNPLLTTGTGTNEPEGIVTGAGVNQRAAATDSLARTDFINLIHSVDRAYRNNGAFMLSDSIISSVRKLEVGSSDSRPLYQPSANSGEPDRIEGYPFAVNNDLPSIAADNKVMTFGDHQKYFLRDVAGAEMMRLEEIHAKRYQVGFVLFERHDGKLLDPNAIATLQMAST